MFNLSMSYHSKLLYLIVWVSSAWIIACIPPHPLLEQVRREEASLPASLRGPELYNPHLRNAISAASLLHHGEELVYARPTDKVTRADVVSMLTHAGFLRRRPQHPSLHRRPPQFYDNFVDHILYVNPEFLQRL